MESHMESFKYWFAIVVAFACLAVLYAFAATLPVYWLWNAVIPEITNNALKELTFLQALQLNLLMAIMVRLWVPMRTSK